MKVPILQSCQQDSIAGAEFRESGRKCRRHVEMTLPRDSAAKGRLENEIKGNF